MKLYQSHKGDVFTIRTEIGDTDDGWQINDGDAPAYTDLVEVLLRCGTKDNTPILAGKYRWSTGTAAADIVAYRIIQPKPKLQLEIGGIYRDREGNTHGPLHAFLHSTYKFKSDLHTWTASGSLFSTGEDPKDLITHIATVPGEGWIAWNEPHCPFTYENPDLEVVTRSGTVQTGDNAQPAKDWYWGPTVALIVAYRVAHPKPKLQLNLAERVAQLEAKLEAHLA